MSVDLLKLKRALKGKPTTPGDYEGQMSIIKELITPLIAQQTDQDWVVILSKLTSLGERLTKEIVWLMSTEEISTMSPALKNNNLKAMVKEREATFSQLARYL